MKLLSVLTCWRAVAVPVPEAAGVRANDICAKSFVNVSSGSFALKASGALAPGVSSRRPKSWSMNWPHTYAHWVRAFSEKMFWPMSLKTRLLTYRADGPPTMPPTPSA